MNNCIAERSNPRHSEIHPAGLLVRRHLGGIALARSLCRLGVCILLLLGFTVPALYAQVQNGTIQGTATDSGGAVVANATVTLTQTATNLVMHGQTNNTGAYSFFQLLPGDYGVTIEKQGFKKNLASLTLTVGQTAQLNFVLEIGSETQTVTVDAGNAVTLDTQTSNLDYTVQAQQVDNLPLNGRNPYGLAILSPGIAAGSNFGVGVAVARGAVVAAATNNFESNGGIGGNNQILLDGVSIVVCCQGQPAVTPSTEVVDQFKVVTSNPPAEYGRTSGAVLNIATKSGGNRLRGNVYEFLRNDKLDAANFFTKRNGVYPYAGHKDFRAPHRENQYGAFVGGPVVLPHLYRGIDKTFFTFGYEAVRNTQPTTGTATVPTDLMRQGVFTEAADKVYDPTSYDPTTKTRKPIPAATCNGINYQEGYCIPGDQFNVVANSILPLIPRANLPGITNNYAYAQNVTDSQNQFNFRIDHNFSDKHRSFVRGTRDTNDHVNYDVFNKPDGPNGAWKQSLTAYLFAVGHLWSITPSTLVQFTYGFARQTNSQKPTLFQYDAAKYGFSNNFTSEQQEPGLPTIAFGGGLQTMGWGAYYNLTAHSVHSLNASVLSQHGKHSLAIGYNGQLVLENNSGVPSGSEGAFTFNTQYTGGPSPNSALPAGQGSFDSWASFLLGYPGNGNVNRNVTTAFNQWITGLYVQDDWRFAPNLTLNLGLRWDVETGFGERHNHWANFNPTATSPLSGAVGMNILGGAQFLGANGNPSRTSPTLYHEVGPRFGFSYAVNDKTVFRGGYGLLFLPISQRGYSSQNIGFTQSTNISSSADGFSPVAKTENAFPDGVLMPAGASAGVGVGAGTSIGGLQYNNPASYQQQWSVGIQRSLTPSMTLTANYVGGHGVDLPLSPRPNDLQPAYFGAQGDKDHVNYLQEKVANPFYGASGLAPGSILRAPQVQRVQLLSAFPQYTSNGSISSLQNWSVSANYLDHGSATYNALQATLLFHRGSGLTGSASYVWSKLLGNVSDLTNGFLNATGNPGVQNYYVMQQEHSILATDTPHRVTGTATYALPFGRGQAFGASLPGWANQIAGGWTVNTILDVYSGYPLSMGVTGTASFAGSRPVSVAGVSPYTPGSTHSRLGKANVSAGYLNPKAFVLPVEFQLGNVPRSAGNIRGPLSFDDNVSVIKRFPVKDDFSLEFRAEAFNVLNKVAFAMPNATVGSSNFGYITSQANSPRNIQLSMKVHF